MSRDSDVKSDPWILAQRWHDALVKARAGDRYELVRMLMLEDRPANASLRKEIFTVLVNPAPVRRLGRKRALSDGEVDYVRQEAAKDRRARKSVTFTMDRLAAACDLSVRTVRDIIAGNKAYARKVITPAVQTKKGRKGTL